MDHATLSIIIGTYNRLDLLKKCLGALDKGVQVDHEIIVVDGGSIDGTLEYLEQSPEVRLVRDGELVGQAKSLNRILGSLNGDFVCWLSDDNLVVDRTLDIAVDILQRDQYVGMVALKIKDITGPNANAPYLGAIWESGILNCNQGMLPSNLLQRLGGFSVEFRDYGMDADLTTRVLLAGYKVVYTKKIAIHHYRDHDTDNWTTKENREQRLQAANDLYRSKYATLVTKKNALPNNSNALFPLFLIKLYKKLRKFPNLLMSEAIVGGWASTFFRDWYNVSNGRFISRWDLFRNFFNAYYLVQQIPETLRLQFCVEENSS